jgi:S-DNA-T family DNA segregation ATPase FtsK/SpoIIIE
VSGRGCRGCPSGYRSPGRHPPVRHGGRSTFLLLLLLSPVLLLATALGDRRNHTVSERARRSAYEAEHAAALAAIAEACTREADDRSEQHPDLARLTAVACGPLGRLWERRPHDPDFAVVRIGRGTLPAA